mgnify:CR=1 FL=1
MSLSRKVSNGKMTKIASQPVGYGWHWEIWPSAHHIISFKVWLFSEIMRLACNFTRIRIDYNDSGRSAKKFP